jgi:hypothetical protein
MTKSFLRIAPGKIAGLALVFCSVSCAQAQGLGPVVYTPYAVGTLAGQAQIQGTNDGAGDQAQFNWPYALAVDRAGTIFVADQASHTLRRVRPDGSVTTIAGSAGNPGANDGTNSDARFNNPSAVVVDGQGTLFVADTYNQLIRQVTPQGSNWVVTTIAGQAGSYRGMSDGPGCLAQFNYPDCLALDSDGALLVGDGNNYTIRRVSGSETNWWVTTFAGQPQNSGTDDGPALSARFGMVGGIALDSAGTIYVADLGGCTIRKITRVGTNATISTIAGQPNIPAYADGTNSGATFYYPGSIAMEGSGNLLIVDSSRTLRRLSPSGVVTTVAGTPGNLGASDGVGPDAGFSGLTGVAVDAVGNVYATDYGNATIRRAFPAGSPPAMAGLNSAMGFDQGKFGFDIAGPPGSNAVVEASGDLMTWSRVWTNAIGGPVLHFEEAPDTNTSRFYRVELR